MKSKHEIPNKTDYMKAYSFNLIQTERTNSELEHEKNIGKIDGVFYKIFSWQIMGKQKERHLSQTESKEDNVESKKQTALSKTNHIPNGRLQERRFQAMLVILFLTTIFLISIYGIMKIEKRKKLLPVKIKKCPQTGDFFVKVIERDVKIHQTDGEGKVVVQSKIDFRGSSAKRYVSTCYLKPQTIPAWYTESLLIHIGSTKRSYAEKVWFKHKLQPYYWSDAMTTETNFPPVKMHLSEAVLPVAESNEHYISLESQQIAAGVS